MNISAQFDSVPELMEFVDTIAGRQVAKPAAAPEAAAPASQEPQDAAAPASQEPQDAEAGVPEIITLVPEPAPAKPRKAKVAPAPAPEPAPAPAPEPAPAPATPGIGVEIRRIMDATRQRIGDDGSDSALHKAASDAFRQIASVMGMKKPTDIKDAEGVLAFETACSRLERLTDGTVGVPEEDVPF